MTTRVSSKRQASGSPLSFSSRVGREIYAALLGAALAASGGCASGRVLTQGEVGRSGARSFAAPTEHVFYACLGILKADGYEMATVDPERGLIVTKPLAVETPDRVTARAYRVNVSPEGQGSRVVAQPILYAGNRDVSADEVWNIAAERDQWADLFSDVDSVVAAPVEIVPALANQQAVAAKAPAAEADENRTAAKTSPTKTTGGFTPAMLDPNGARGSRTPTAAPTTRKADPSP